jgi:hypothetical protein
MAHLIPPSFHLRFSFSIPRVGLKRGKPRPVFDLPQDGTLLDVGRLDENPAFAEVRAGWNPAGWGVSVEVRGRLTPPESEQGDETSGDRIELMFDTRPTGDLHRATRYCHRFIAGPARGGWIRPQAIRQAKEPFAFPPEGLVQVQCQMHNDGYRLAVWFPAESLVGYDPATSAQLAFFYILRDQEKGIQCLAYGTEFPVDHDPSLWQILELDGAG